MGLMKGWSENVKSVMNGTPAKAMQNLANGEGKDLTEVNQKLDKIIEMLSILLSDESKK